MGYEVTAVDSSPHMLDALAERAEAAAVPTNALALVHSHGPGLPGIVGEGTVDVVVARAVLIHHDYESVEAIVGVLAALLRPGGHLLADWPTGEPGERADWIGVTRWHPHHRLAVARLAGLEPVDTAAEPSVWRKAES
jgi:SAM-dependent methyltransferase